MCVCVCVGMQFRGFSLEKLKYNVINIEQEVVLCWQDIYIYTLCGR